MILSDGELKKRILQIKTDDQFNNAKCNWEDGNWAAVKDSILIYPLQADNRGVCTYDFCMGTEYVRLRMPDEVIKIDKDQVFNIRPGETILILTQEYVALPKNVMGMIIPRSRWIFEGTSICASRIDPTWFGRLVVGFTNLTKNRVQLQSGEPFCACYFIETSEVDEPITKANVPHLGRTSIGRLSLSHVRPEIPLSPEKVTRDDLESVVREYGVPWDILQGALTLTQRELQVYMEREVAPDIVEEATSAALKRAFDDLIKLNSRLVWGVFGLMTAFLGAIATIGYLIYLLVSGQ